MRCLTLISVRVLKFRRTRDCKKDEAYVPQLLVLFVLRPNVDDDGVNPLSDQVLDALQSQLQQTVAVLQKSKFLSTSAPADLFVSVCAFSMPASC